MKRLFNLENTLLISLFSVLILYSFMYIPFYSKGEVINSNIKYILLVLTLVSLYFIEDHLSKLPRDNVIFDFSISLSILYFVSKIIPELSIILDVGIIYMIYKLCIFFWKKFKDSDGDFVSLLLLMICIFGLIMAFELSAPSFYINF